jgi:hypothetical protein
MYLYDFVWPRRFDARQRCDDLFVRQIAIVNRHADFIDIIDHCFKTIFGKVEEHFIRVVQSMSRLVIRRRFPHPIDRGVLLTRLPLKIDAMTTGTLLKANPSPF